MIYDAYQIINLDDFNNSGLVSKEVTLIVGNMGVQNILVTKGNLVSILFNDVLLSLDLNSKNPFEFETYAAFVDPNNNVWLGIPHVS